MITKANGKTLDELVAAGEISQFEGMVVGIVSSVACYVRITSPHSTMEKSSMQKTYNMFITHGMFPALEGVLVKGGMSPTDAGQLINDACHLVVDLIKSAEKDLFDPIDFSREIQA